jgi:hypothetical protein
LQAVLFIIFISEVLFLRSSRCLKETDIKIALLIGGWPWRTDILFLKAIK